MKASSMRVSLFLLSGTIFLLAATSAHSAGNPYDRLYKERIKEVGGTPPPVSRDPAPTETIERLRDEAILGKTGALSAYVSELAVHRMLARGITKSEIDRELSNNRLGIESHSGHAVHNFVTDEVLTLAQQGVVEAQEWLATKSNLHSGIKNEWRLIAMRTKNPPPENETTLEKAQRAKRDGDVQMAISEYTKLAELGDLNAQYELVHIYLHMKEYKIQPDYKQAYYWMKVAAKNGHPIAQNDLGSAYYGGVDLEGVAIPQNYNEALRLYRLASDQNEPNSTRNIGFLYLHGFGVEKNFVKAREFFERAKSLGNGLAAVDLGHIYEEGLGVTINKRRALDFYREAATMNATSASENIARVANQIEIEKIDSENQKAGSLSRKSKENNFPFEEDILNLLMQNYAQESRPDQKVEYPDMIVRSNALLGDMNRIVVFISDRECTPTGKHNEALCHFVENRKTIGGLVQDLGFGRERVVNKYSAVFIRTPSGWKSPDLTAYFKRVETARSQASGKYEYARAAWLNCARYHNGKPSFEIENWCGKEP